MNSTEKYYIWDPETGITKIETDQLKLSASEIPGIKAVWTDQQDHLKDTAQLSEFLEQLKREWAIETGIIENLYDIERGVTQTLIEHGFSADHMVHGSKNKPREYVIQLLKDQKDALDGVFDFVKNERSLSTSYIKELHAALLRSQDMVEGTDTLGHQNEVKLIKGAWKKEPNYPTRDGKTYMYCPPEHVASEMDRLIAMHADHIKEGVPSDVQAAWFHHRFTQIHPFQDGNGRMARAIASLILVKDGLFPMVVTRDDKPTYVNALESADAGDLEPLVKLIVKLQIKKLMKATHISEAIFSEEDVDAALVDLHKKADADRSALLKTVSNLAGIIEGHIKDSLENREKEILLALKKKSSDARVWVKRSNPKTDHYFRTPLIKNAKTHLNYYADTSDYRSWVALYMNWSRRRGQLVFTIHGIGRPFNGSLICAPFFEFKETDEDSVMRSTLIPVTDEGFLFFENESQERILSRLDPWLKRVIVIALKELTKSL